MLELVVGPRVVLGPSAAAPGQKERRLGKLRPLPGKRTIAIHRRHAHPFDSNLSPFDEPIVEPLQPLRRTFPLREIEDALIGHVHRPVSLHRRQQVHLRAPIIRRQSFSGHAKGQEANYQQDGGEEEIRGVPTERVPQRTEQSSGLFRRAEDCLSELEYPVAPPPVDSQPRIKVPPDSAPKRHATGPFHNH